MARAIGRRLGLTEATGAILQANRVGHTKADGWHRLATSAIFPGEVDADTHYILVDDRVGFGGTLTLHFEHFEQPLPSAGRVWAAWRSPQDFARYGVPPWFSDIFPNMALLPEYLEMCARPSNTDTIPIPMKVFSSSP
jgi:hypothetical protein